jgi:hypothetical protein
MNIRCLNNSLSRIKELSIIGKNVDVDGISCHVMGIVRYSTQLRLLVLQYDPDFQQLIEEAGRAEACEMTNIPMTNRLQLKSSWQLDVANPFGAVSRVFIADKEFEVNCSESQQLSHQDWECILLLSKFLHHGWQADGIDFQEIDMLYLTSLELEGDCLDTPNIGDGLELRFVTRPVSTAHLVEQPLFLNVGEEYSDKLWFRDSITGEKHWAQINRVYLSDMWAEMEKVFDNPKIKEQMTPEQISEAKANFEESFSKICPKGMCLPVIEYECEEDISLQFYSKAFLDAEAIQENCASAIGFVVRPDRPAGILGLKLKAAIIQEPFPPATSCIEAELFQYYKTISRDDIVLK